MKMSFFLTTFCLISLSAFLVYSKFNANRDSTSITITEANDTYQLDAYYNANNTIKVLQYINRSIEPNGPLNPGNDYFDVTTRRIDITTTLSDKTEFCIKESPGKLKIVFDKRKNSSSSYWRIKAMCEGIKNVLAGK
jgi:hypothetical protein